MERFIMTRTCFCQSCYDKGNPRHGMLFITYGHTNQTFHPYLVSDDAKLEPENRGFTPHVINLLKIEDDKVYIQVFCGMEGCGVSIYKDAKNQYQFTILKTRTIVLKHEDFKALIQFTDSGYRI